MRNRKGFTLLEAAVSLAILSLTGLAAFGAMSRDLDAAARVRVALESAALAEDRMEAVRILSPASLAALPDSIARGEFPEPFGEYGWSVAVVPVSDVPGLYDVNVTVRRAANRRSLAARLYRPAPSAGMEGNSP